MPKIINPNVIGQVFGEYTITGFRLGADGRTKVKAVCSCGHSTVQDFSDIRDNVQGCRSCRSKHKKNNTKYIRHEEQSNMV